MNLLGNPGELRSLSHIFVKSEFFPTVTRRAICHDVSQLSGRGCLDIRPGGELSNPFRECIRRPASGNLAFHSMDLLDELREVGRKNDSFSMPALVTVCW